MLDLEEGNHLAVEETASGYGAVLRNPHFLLVWAAQVLSQTAQNAVNYALVVEVERLTHSSANVGWVIVASACRRCSSAPRPASLWTG